MPQTNEIQTELDSLVIQVSDLIIQRENAWGTKVYDLLKQTLKSNGLAFKTDTSDCVDGFVDIMDREPSALKHGKKV